MTLTLERPAAELLTPLDQKILASTRSIAQDIEAACARVPPLWPLQNFVAVNPFVGLSDTKFVAACALMRRTAHARLLMPAAHYRKQQKSGAIKDRDLQSALDQSGAKNFDVAALKDALQTDWKTDESDAILTVADALDASLDTAWRSFMVDEISKWCSAYYDKGQASWRMPWRDQGLFAAWKEAALLDANPEMMGLKNFRRFVATLPDSPEEVVALALETLEIPASGATDFLHRELLAMAGWSGYVQYLARGKRPLWPRRRFAAAAAGDFAGLRNRALSAARRDGVSCRVGAQSGALERRARVLARDDARLFMAVSGGNFLSAAVDGEVGDARK